MLRAADQKILRLACLDETAVWTSSLYYKSWSSMHVFPFRFKNIKI